MKRDNTLNAFLALVRAGLWESEVRLSEFVEIDFNELYRLAQEQSVIGLVAAGLEHVVDYKVPKEISLQFAGQTILIEQQNKAMNHFVETMVAGMREADIYTLLVKGQGIAQCYERPFWRSCGDVDLFLSDDNYIRAKKFLEPLASEVEQEKKYERHIGFIIDSWTVELHGNLRTGISNSIDKGVDEIQKEVFFDGSVRSWINNGTYIFLPSENTDALLVFTHILQHFFKGGIGLRQICDWCRLLWMYRDTIDQKTLEKRIRQMGIMTEWKTFASLAVHALGIEKSAMPFYQETEKWRSNGEKVLSVVIETGNMGHNRDLSYQQNDNTTLRKFKTFVFLTKDTFRHLSIFPLDSIKAWWNIMVKGINVII